MRRLLLIASMMLAACGTEQAEPPGQVVLYVDTDAIVPLAAGEPGDEWHSPLFDALLLEVIEPGAGVPCEGCSREFAVNQAAFLHRSVSIGIPLPVGLSGYRARATLFRSEARRLGEPPPQASLQAVLSLPSVDETGIREVHVVLETDAVGIPLGTLENPAQGIPGKPPASRAGTWRGAARSWCNGSPAEGEVCVPGGAFWMGSTVNGRQEHLVLLSPFYMSRTEVTVAQYRKHVQGWAGVDPWSGSNAGTSVEDFCSYTPSSGAKDGYPIACLTWEAARKYCLSIGADLPTEAQFEYAARGLKSQNYVWGRDAPACGDAVFGRAGHGVFAGETGVCNPEPPGGFLPPGHGRRDKLVLPDGEILDLVANVGEYTRDAWQPLDGPFWGRPTLFEDPYCQEHDSTGEWVGRGATWSASIVGHVSDIRGNASSYSVYVGFRCVRPG